MTFTWDDFYDDPRGIHVFEHDPKNGLSTQGKSTESTGGEIHMSAPGGRSGYMVWSAAETFFLKQFNWFGSKYIAFLAFGEGDAEKILDYGAKHGNILGGCDEGEEDEDAEATADEHAVCEEKDGEDEEEEDGDDDA